MKMSNYGRFDAVTIGGLSVLNSYPNKVFWLDSGGGGGSRGTFNRPFLTLDEAFASCTANAGDVILVKPGHSETITGVGGITADQAGVSVVGLGSYNIAPTFLMDGAATVTALITADNVTFENLIFKAGHADIAIWGLITGVGCTIKDCRFIENAANENWVDVIHAGTTDNDYNGLSLVGNEFIMDDAACVTAIDLLKDSADVKIVGNRITGDFDATPFAPIYSASTEVHKNILVTKNLIHNAHNADAAVGISIANTSSTGWIVDNDIGHQDVAAETPVLAGAAGLYVGNNRASGVLGTASGYTYPAIDS